MCAVSESFSGCHEKHTISHPSVIKQGMREPVGLRLPDPEGSVKQNASSGNLETLDDTEKAHLREALHTACSRAGYIYVSLSSSLTTLLRLSSSLVENQGPGGCETEFSELCKGIIKQVSVQ